MYCHSYLHEMAIIVDQNHGYKSFSRARRSRLQSFTQLDYKFLQLNQTNVSDSIKQAYKFSNIPRSISTPCLSLSASMEDEFDDTSPRIEIVGGNGTPRLHTLVVEVANAMASGVDPLPISSGLGGAYFLRSRNGDKIAVAKPIDEEPLAFNNPKGVVDLMEGQPAGLNSSVRVGETGIRELAAYLLDHGEFAGVPPTALVKFSHVDFHVHDTASILAPPYKIASLQSFVDHEFDAGELGPSGYSVASVHRIGIFDVRLLNLDRHAGNMLVRKHDQDGKLSLGEADLVPIDHGLCLPEWLDDPYFEWLHWPQALIPFSESEVEYISNIDPFKDAELLRTELPSLRESSIRVLVLCTIFLKRAVAAGLCLANIGEMMTRKVCVGEKNLSLLENLCELAKTNMVSLLDNENINAQSKEHTVGQESEDSFNDVVQLQLLNSSACKLPKIPRFSSVKSMSGVPDSIMSKLYKENGYHHVEYGAQITEIDDDNKDNNLNCESGVISFGDMNEKKWRLFLEQFEKLLPEVFEDTKSTGFKQRLVTSC